MGQSDDFQVPAHTELMWILSCSASVGYLTRMTQWKVKLLLLPYVSNVAESGYRVSFHCMKTPLSWTQTPKQDSNLAFSPTLFCRRQMCWSIGTCYSRITNTIAYGEQGYNGSGGRRSSSASGICSGVRRQFQPRLRQGVSRAPDPNM